MKKIVLMLSMIFVIMVAAGCSGNNDKMEAVVYQVEPERMAIYTTQGEGGLGVISITEKIKFLDEEGKAVSSSDILPGQLIEITHSGIVAEMYPPLYPGVRKIQIKGMADEALYTKAIEAWEAWECQP